MVAGERRRHRRIRARGLAAHVRALDRSFTCSVENLSEGGIFLATDEPLPRGSMVAIDLVKPLQAKALRVIGVVVAETAGGSATALAKAAANGMGIQFAQQAPEARAQLLALLAELAGQPAREPGAPARAIVTPFAGESAIAAPRNPADIEALRAELQALRKDLSQALRERDAREAELQALRDQLVAARHALGAGGP